MYICMYVCIICKCPYCFHVHTVTVCMYINIHTYVQYSTCSRCSYIYTYICTWWEGGTHTLSAMCTCGVHHIHTTFLRCARSATSSAGVRRWQGWRRTWTGASRGGRSCSGRWKRQWQLSLPQQSRCVQGIQLVVCAYVCCVSAVHTYIHDSVRTYTYVL